MTTILGIHAGHDASCALVRDGVIVADAQEERFARIKHSGNVPVSALLYCLKTASVANLNDVDIVAVPSRQPQRTLAALFGQTNRQSSMERVRPPLYFPDLRLRDSTKFRFVEHHLAHAASAHFTRPTGASCLVFTFDGIGDGVSTAVWQAQNNRIVPLQRLGRGASVGWPYGAVTEALGWRHGDGEGTTMGLAPYGDSGQCAGVLDKYFPELGRSGIKRPMALGPAYAWDESGAMHWHFDEASEIRTLAETYSRENIAAEAQRKLEECVLRYIREWVEVTGIRQTAYSGGVFLNVKLNQRVWAKLRPSIDAQHIFPNPGDAGLAVGAALHAYYTNNEFFGAPLRSIFWGPEYSDEQIGQFLRMRGLACETVGDPSARAADLLVSGKIVGWFQDRMESGPRALGNRSILMSPQLAENKDIINAKVKFREAFRPFCPSILMEKYCDYLLDAKDEYFMINSFYVNPQYLSKLAAVVHVDGTVRPQMVTRDNNEKFWRLINAFGNRTGVFAVLNTSMNIKGEPIVNTPSEAIRLFFDTGLDSLFLGRFLLQKDQGARPSSVM